MTVAISLDRSDDVRLAVEAGPCGSTANPLAGLTIDHMDFKLQRLSNYSDDSLLEELRRVAALVPVGPMTRTSFAEHSRVSASTIINRFGGWRQALDKAGLGARYSGKSVTARMREQSKQSISRDEVISELRQVAAKIGRNDVTVEDFDSNASFSVARVRSHFRLWCDALDAAGLEARQSSVRYTDEECFENLLQVWTSLGRPPKYLEMNSPLSQVGAKAYISRWQTWLRALEAFVERVNQDDAAPSILSDTPASCLTSDKPFTPSETGKEDDGRIRLGLRYRAIVRDNFKCVLCGNSPATDPTCRLHVDHIHPYSKGGPTTLENLRTLCDFCNIGKSNLTIERAR